MSRILWFSVYTAKLFHVVAHHQQRVRMHADDIQVYVCQRRSRRSCPSLCVHRQHQRLNQPRQKLM